MKKVDGLLALSLCLTWAAWRGDPGLIVLSAGASFIPLPTVRAAPRARLEAETAPHHPWLEAVLGGIAIWAGSDLLALTPGATMAVLALYGLALAMSVVLAMIEGPRLAARAVLSRPKP